MRFESLEFAGLSCLQSSKKETRDRDKEANGMSKEAQLKVEAGGSGDGLLASGVVVSGAIASESCRLCGKSVANIKKHMKSHFPDKYQCHICMISLTRSDNLKRHIKLKHGIREGSASAASLLGSSYYGRGGLDAKHFLAKSEPPYLA